MKILMESKNGEKPTVNVGDFLETKGGRKIMIVTDEKDCSYRILDLEANELTQRSYQSVKDALENFSNNYFIHKAENVELVVKGVGLKWQ